MLENCINNFCQAHMVDQMDCLHWVFESWEEDFLILIKQEGGEELENINDVEVSKFQKQISLFSLEHSD